MAPSTVAATGAVERPRLHPADLGEGEVVGGFTDRHGGRSVGPYASLNLARHVGDDPAAVATNRDLLARALDVPSERLVAMSQVHGTAVAVVDGPTAEPTADALVTAATGLALVVLVADCVPVLLADAESGVVGAVHAGRAGTVAGVLPRAVAAMVGLGARAEQIRASLGPSVCAGCYEVPRAMHDDAVTVEPALAATSNRGTLALDLRAGLVAQLRAVGVTAIEVSAVCTARSPEHFSYRRDGVTGRFAGVVVRRSTS